MKSLRYIIAAALLAASGVAHGATQTDSFTVQTTAYSPTQCGVYAENMNFPAYNPAASTNSDASARVEVACTAARAYTVYPNDGYFVLGGQTRMQNQWGPGYMNYDMYTDSSRTTKWNVANTFSGTGTGIGNYLTHTVYGRVPTAQGAADGSQDGPYRDYLTVTVEFN